MPSSERRKLQDLKDRVRRSRSIPILLINSFTFFLFLAASQSPATLAGRPRKCFLLLTFPLCLSILVPLPSSFDGQSSNGEILLLALYPHYPIIFLSPMYLSELLQAQNILLP